MYINQNIKRLRRGKNITQEKLAEYLGVSTQAVSKWERGETLPDITMILPLASYFNVSADELLGLDTAKKEAKIKEYLNGNQLLLMQGRWDEATELMTKAHKKYPDDFRIINGYMQLISGGNADNQPEVVASRAAELTGLCERILEECTADDIRYNAVDILAKVNKAQGNVDKALELLDRLPDWSVSRYQKCEQLFEKTTDEWRYWIHYNFFVLSDFAINKLGKIIWFSGKPFDEKESAANRIIEYLLKICDETEYEPLHHIIFTVYNEMGCHCYRQNKFDKTVHYFDLALKYAVMFDDFIASDRQILQNGGQLKDGIAMQWGNIENGKWNTVKRQLEWYKNNPWFNELRERDDFMPILKKYELFAKDIG
ncbi:MAG: helix-turn-helix domain-containing protein [Oscillospiraceae bacterium]|nr:helix-turn-helix domain-containing protein [Oscillospiraceae bacterium]